MSNQIFQTRLENGLQVLLKEIHTAPIISHWVWYRVGSRYEVPGKTGISHWVEHMQFKGTPRFPAGVLDRAISRDGGMWNAFTHLDWTTFFETMPADKIDLALNLEADRMVNSVYDSEEVNSERTVVISEREGSENDPLFRLDEAVQSTMFSSHPYKNEVIGSIRDLRAIQRDDLYAHYQRYYNPANAVIAVAGDFDTNDMVEKIERYYGSIAGQVLPDLLLDQEQLPDHERRVNVSGPGETTYLQISYRAPAAVNHDFFPFTILDSLITGPTSLNMFGGGGISNKTSRLYRRLVEKEFAISVNGSLQATVDPFLYNIVITVHPKHSPEEVLSQVDEEIDTLFQSLVTQAEIDRAAKQARALFAYGSENITNQAFWMGYSEMFDQYSWFLNYVKRLEQVTAVDLLRIAREYLQPGYRVVGIYRPDGGQQ
ncbi:MAG: insulinase family protein [Anaerolineaceae bacterium]|nr:insulinase family protein [Anaerolineaceae bacterium]